MTDDGRKTCSGCQLPRRVFVVFEDRDGKSPVRHGEFDVCSFCTGSGAELVRQPTPVPGGA